MNSSHNKTRLRSIVHGRPRAGKKVLQEDLSELDSLVIARRSIGAAPSWARIVADRAIDEG